MPRADPSASDDGDVDGRSSHPWLPPLRRCGSPLFQPCACSHGSDDQARPASRSIHHLLLGSAPDSCHTRRGAGRGRGSVSQSYPTPLTAPDAVVTPAVGVNVPAGMSEGGTLKLAPSRYGPVGSLTRGGKPPSDVTVRYADGTVAVVPADTFEKDRQDWTGARLKTRPCTVCGNAFPATSPNRRYCGQKCHQAAAKRRKEARLRSAELEERRHEVGTTGLGADAVATLT
jgi:ribosomal protein S27AE